MKVLAYDSLPAALEASTSLGGALRAVAARAVFVGFLLAARDGVRGQTRENQGDGMQEKQRRDLSRIRNGIPSVHFLQIFQLCSC